MAIVTDGSGVCERCGGESDALGTTWHCELCGRLVCTACLSDRDDGWFCAGCAETIASYPDPAEIPAGHPAWERLLADLEGVSRCS